MSSGGAGQPAYRAPIFVPGGITSVPRAGPGSGLTLPSVLLFLCAVLVIVGSLTPWVTESILTTNVSIDGNQAGLSTAVGPGVNGWFTFVGGVVLLVFGALMVASGGRALRQLAALIAFFTLGLAAYDMARVTYKISNLPSFSLRGAPAAVNRVFALTDHLGVGFGLILLLAAALGVMIAALAALRSA